jgi:hypothetical protein
MNDIAGIPYLEAEFDEKGRLLNAVTLPAGVTDAVVVAHGWNNSAAEARQLYSELFTNFVGVATAGDLPGRSFAVVGVIWPSKKFDELVAAAESDAAAGGGASIDQTPASRAPLDAKLDSMKELFKTPEQQQAIERARSLIGDLQEKGSARRQFVDAIRSLVDPAHADPEDASQIFFKEDGNELMERLRIDSEDVDEEVAASGGAAALFPGAAAPAPSGGAAGFFTTLAGFAGSALNVLNYTTYYMMKERAGQVGVGVGALIDTSGFRGCRIHLVGHSFGARVVTSAAANSTTDRIRSMTLLQAAFSHNGFSKSQHGFFRSVVERRRVNGPICITHTRNDRAVGIAYPLASRLAGQTAAAFGDENDKYGGLGRNGVQKMETGEREAATRSGREPCSIWKAVSSSPATAP